MSAPEEIKAEYASSLADLTFNSKPLINVLTMLADENSPNAKVIVEAIEEHLSKVQTDVKLPLLYLIDCIVKNVGGTYTSLFSQNIVSTFCGVFKVVDEKTRAEMYKLRQTWNEVFPQMKLYAIDVQISLLDPAWPVTAKPPTNSIHLNPKFLQKTSGSQSDEDQKSENESSDDAKSTDTDNSDSSDSSDTSSDSGDSSGAADLDERGAVEATVKNKLSKDQSCRKKKQKNGDGTDQARKSPEEQSNDENLETDRNDWNDVEELINRVSVESPVAHPQYSETESEQSDNENDSDATTILVSDTRKKSQPSVIEKLDKTMESRQSNCIAASTRSENSDVIIIETPIELIDITESTDEDEVQEVPVTEERISASTSQIKFLKALLPVFKAMASTPTENVKLGLESISSLERWSGSSERNLEATGSKAEQSIHNESSDPILGAMNDEAEQSIHDESSEIIDTEAEQSVHNESIETYLSTNHEAEQSIHDASSEILLETIDIQAEQSIHNESIETNVSTNHKPEPSIHDESSEILLERIDTEAEQSVHNESFETNIEPTSDKAEQSVHNESSEATPEEMDNEAEQSIHNDSSGRDLEAMDDQEEHAVHNESGKPTESAIPEPSRIGGSGSQEDEVTPQTEPQEVEQHTYEPLALPKRPVEGPKRNLEAVLERIQNTFRNRLPEAGQSEVSEREPRIAESEEELVSPQTDSQEVEQPEHAETTRGFKRRLETSHRRPAKKKKGDYAVFGKHVAATLSNLSELSAIHVKFLISNILYKAELGEYDTRVLPSSSLNSSMSAGPSQQSTPCIHAPQNGGSSTSFNRQQSCSKPKVLRNVPESPVHHPTPPVPSKSKKLPSNRELPSHRELPNRPRTQNSSQETVKTNVEQKKPQQKTKKVLKKRGMVQKQPSSKDSESATPESQRPNIPDSSQMPDITEPMKENAPKSPNHKSPVYDPVSPVHPSTSSTVPVSNALSPLYSPIYTPGGPVTPRSPVYSRSSPIYAPASPVYCPIPWHRTSSPFKRPPSSFYRPASPVNRPASPVNRPVSLVNRPSSVYRLISSLERSGCPLYRPAPQVYSPVVIPPTSQTDSPASPTYYPSPIHSPNSPI